MRRQLIEVDILVAGNNILVVDIKFMVWVHRHQYRANIGLKNMFVG